MSQRGQILHIATESAFGTGREEYLFKSDAGKTTIEY